MSLAPAALPSLLSSQHLPSTAPAPDTPPSVATWGPHPTYAHPVLKRDNGYKGDFKPLAWY